MVKSTFADFWKPKQNLTNSSQTQTELWKRNRDFWEWDSNLHDSFQGRPDPATRLPTAAPAPVIRPDRPAKRDHVQKIEEPFDR